MCGALQYYYFCVYNISSQRSVSQQPFFFHLRIKHVQLKLKVQNSKMNQINRMILMRSVVSAGFASVMVASEHYLFELTGNSARRTKRITSLISTLSSAQSLPVNAIAGFLIDRYGRKPVLCLYALWFGKILPVLYPRVWVTPGTDFGTEPLAYHDCRQCNVCRYVADDPQRNINPHFK